MIEQIEKLKLRLGNGVNEQLIESLLEDAEAEILDYCYRNELTPKMLSLQRELAIIYYNRLGSEGESSRSEGGVSVSYQSDIPQNLKNRLNSYRLLKVVRIANANKK